MANRKIVVLGNVVADVLARPVDDVPRTGSLHPKSVTFHPGGCGGNSAVALARLGIPVQLVACTGEDPFGTALLAVWRKEGVDTAHVKRLPSVATGVTVVLVDSQGDRRFISAPQANTYLTPETLPAGALEGSFALHVAGFFAAPGLEDGTLPARLAEAREQGILTSLDPVTGRSREYRHHLYPLLPHLDLLLLNEGEGERVTGEKEPEAIIDWLLAAGAGTVILKVGPRGCIVRGARGSYRVPAYPARVVDSTGAGDAFAGALLAALARNTPFREALAWASAAGAATVEAPGATGDWQGWADLSAIRDRATG